MKKLKTIFEKLYHMCSVIKTYTHEKKDIKKKKDLYKNITLTKEQEKKIDNIWKKNYGKKISKKWHRLYVSYCGKFNELYFPEIYFTTNLLYKLNPSHIKKILADKMLTQFIFDNSEIKNKKVKTVKNYVYNSSGIYYDENGVISKNEVIKKLYNIGEVIVKPTSDTSSGNNVRLVNIKNGIDSKSKKSIEEIIKLYKENFTFQEKIIQHSTFAKLNASSVNTIRINTYICDGKVYYTPITMRIGSGGG